MNRKSEVDGAVAGPVAGAALEEGGSTPVAIEEVDETLSYNVAAEGGAGTGGPGLVGAGSTGKEAVDVAESCWC